MSDEGLVGSDHILLRTAIGSPVASLPDLPPLICNSSSASATMSLSGPSTSSVCTGGDYSTANWCLPSPVSDVSEFSDGSMELAEPLRILLERTGVLRSSFLASALSGVMEPVGSGLGSPLLLPARADLLGTPASQKQEHVISGKSDNPYAMPVLSEDAENLLEEDESYGVQCAKDLVTTSCRARELTPTSPSTAVVRLAPTATSTVGYRRSSESEPISARPRTLTHNAVVGLRLVTKHVLLPVEDDSAFAIGETPRQWDRRFPVAHRIMRSMYGATLDRLQTLRAEHRKAKTLTSPTVRLGGRMHLSPTAMPLKEVVA